MLGIFHETKIKSIWNFKFFKALIENSFRKKIKSIRLDNGSEYIKIYFHHYCESYGIWTEHSAPYTPQHNGVVERKNRSLKEMETCLLQANNSPPSLWAEAVNCASYIQNRVPHKLVVGATPFEALLGHKPNVSHLRVFGSKAWAIIPNDKRKAFQT